MKTKKVKLASVFSVVSVVVAVIALIVMAGFNVKVMAAPSVGTGAQVVNSEHDANLNEGYKTEVVTETDAYHQIQVSARDVKETIDQTNNMLTTDTLTEQLSRESRDNSAVVAMLKGKTPLTEIFDLSPRQYQRQESDGCYHVTLYIPVITESTSGVIALHYSTVRNVWETIAPEKQDLGEKLVTFKFQDLSPVMILADRQVAGKKIQAGVGDESVTANRENTQIDMSDATRTGRDSEAQSGVGTAEKNNAGVAEGPSTVTVTTDEPDNQKSDTTAETSESSSDKNDSAKEQKGVSWMVYLVMAGFFATVALVLIITVIMRV